jgi:hypothetical protein
MSDVGLRAFFIACLIAATLLTFRAEYYYACTDGIPTPEFCP